MSGRGRERHGRERGRERGGGREGTTQLQPTCDVDFMVVGVFGDRGPCEEEEGEEGMELNSSSGTSGWAVPPARGVVAVKTPDWVSSKSISS